MLELKNITLENFGIIKEKRTFSFKPGMNIIQAPNGKGKSSVTQAIEMLLANSYEGAYEDYINDTSTFFKACLDFAINSTPYTISLHCKKSKNTLTTEKVLSSNDKELASGEEATTYISTLLDPTLTRYSLISKQENKDNIVTCKDIERMDIFKKFKDISLEKDINRLIVPIIDGIKNQIVEVDKEIYRLNHIQYDYQEVPILPFTPEVYEEKKEKQSYLSQLVTARENKIKEYNEKKENLSASLKKIENYKSILTSKKDKESALSTSIIELEKGDKLAESISALQSTLATEIGKVKQQSIADRNKYVEERKAKTALVESTTKEIEELNKQISAITLEKLVKFDDTNIKKTEMPYLSLLCLLVSF